MTAGGQFAQQRQAGDAGGACNQNTHQRSPAFSRSDSGAQRNARITVVATRPPASSQPITSPAPWCGSTMWLIECSAQCSGGERQGGYPPRHPANGGQQQQALRYLERGVVEDVVVVADPERAEGVEEHAGEEHHEQPEAEGVHPEDDQGHLDEPGSCARRCR